MPIVRDVSERLKDRKRREVEALEATFEPNHGDRQATIKEISGSTRHATQPGKTWISLWNQPESLIPVWNNTALEVAESHVWVGPQVYPPFALEIKGSYQGGLAPNTVTYGGAYGSSDHGDVHQTADESSPGAAPVSVFQPMMQMLKTTGDGSTLTITIQPLIYFRGARRVTYPGQTLDVTSYVPGAGLTRRILVYLDIGLNQIGVVTGSTVSSTGAIPVPYPDIPDNSYPSAYVQLTVGQTAVTTATHVEDTRDFIRPRVSTGDFDHTGQGQSDGLHSAFRWVWADDTAREAETTVTTNDVSYRSVGLQEDTGTLWIAGDENEPIDWQQVGESGHYVRRNINDHTLNTWFSLYTDGASEQLTIATDTVWTVDVHVTGKTVVAHALHWSFHILGVVANHGGTVTASQLDTDNIYRGDTGYEAQIAADDTNNALEIQIRRISGGVDWDIQWTGTVRKSLASY
jgi:hypothetical protein